MNAIISCSAEDRSKIEEALPAAEPVYLEAAAQAFQARGDALPDDEKIVASQIAAAPRRRAITWS
jgi:hypothetical protein